MALPQPTPLAPSPVDVPVDLRSRAEVDAPLASVVRIDSLTRPAQPQRPTRAQYARRRTVALLLLVGLLLLAAITARAAMASMADAEPLVAGYAVVEPGMTLWDVAVDRAPSGEDVRTYLHDLQSLNGLATADVDAWTVVALPPR